MGKNSLVLLSALLILISLTCLVKSQENHYEKIKAMAAGTYKEPEPVVEGEEIIEKEEITQEDRELYNKTPVYPSLNQRFFCDQNASTEKVYEDVMKNHNYQK